MRNPSTMRIWIPFSSESDSSASGDRLTPWERANLIGFSCQPFTVFTMASMSRAVITESEEGKKRKRVGFTTCAVDAPHQCAVTHIIHS